MFTTMRARARHRRLMAVADAVVREAVVVSTTPEERATPARVACLAFARHQMRIGDEEAADYLAAALVARGYASDHRPAPDPAPHVPALMPDAIPAQRTGAVDDRL
ncbi:hypothetical protein [Streptomyces sp. NPDC047999]|uniref:hypothetical protein n=1 Tax=Streptomyces sp. NPDC047999 TaxID=3365497 RepID=UPI00371091E3